jgi:exonuclease SbcC
MKIVHLADVHFCKDHANEALAYLKCVEDYVKSNPVDMIGIAGDLFDSAILNSENARLSEFIDSIKRLGDSAPTAMVYGTPSHDVDGSLEIFKAVNCKYGITILDPGQAYFLAPAAGGIFPESEANRLFNKEDRGAIIFGIPEPRKKYLLATTSAGKDETEEAIRGAMHRLCFLLAAKRQEYRNLPCVVLYHGDVAGSTLQNDQTVERGTGIAITVDDLNDIGADYYLLGHIHKPQQVGNLPAYYAGSIYPKNFGETHQAGFNMVELTQTGSYGFNADVKRIDFPHPQNHKIEASCPIGNDFPVLDIVGKRVWLEITCSKEQRALINADVELARLWERGSVEGSRVTVNELPVETVRAAEITEANTPVKKFEIWAENSNVKCEGAIIKKIESLETEITMGSARAAGEWELVSLRLRGAIGIKKGVHKDEISLNFDDYTDGLVALTGANGRGKTTLIENCHPYPQLLTRKGKLQDHFFLRDSFREVVYRDRSAGGKQVKFLIQIDGQNKSGACKYFVFDASGYPTLTSDYEWIPRPGVDGNLKPYEEALNGLFGPMELYLRTAFITQRPTKNLPDLTDATAGEKKTLFVELAGIDYLQRFAETAVEKSKQEAAKNHDAEIRVRMLETEVFRKDDVEIELHNSEISLKKAQKELTEVTEQGKTAKADVDRLREAFSVEKARQEKENEARKAVDRVQDEINTLDADKTRYQEFVKSKSVYEKEIAEYETLQKTADAENEKKRKVLEANSAKQQEYTRNLSAHNQKVKAIEAERDNLCEQRNSLERLVATAESNIRLAEKDEEVDRGRLCKPLEDRKAEIDREILTEKNCIKLYERDAAEITEDCPTCGQKLPENKITELKAKREEYVRKIDSKKYTIDTMNAELTSIDKKVHEAIQQAAEQREEKTAKETAEIQKYNGQLAEINKQIGDLTEQVADLSFDEPAPVKLDVFNDSTLRTATAKMSFITIEQSRASLVKAQAAAVRIEGLEKQIEDKIKLLEEKRMEVFKLITGIEEGTFTRLSKELESAISRHAVLTERYTEVKAEIARQEATIEAGKRSLAAIEDQENELESLRKQTAHFTQEGVDWDLIAKAFGKDGIQALELDALAPGISETANRILESAYGDRFRIEIRTTRIGGAGKKTKQIEDFLIYVIDSEDGEAVLLDDKSGGEAVWIKRAIYDAFAVIRKRNTNFAFLSCFQDEADGALDSAAKTAYCRMLEAAHAESKMRHTFIITHSNEVKAMIDQKIDMEELAAVV